MNISDTEIEAAIVNNKDWAMTRTMADFVRDKPQKNLTPVVFNPSTKKTKLTLMMIPEWGVWFPPYNLSRLSAVARAAGYPVTVYDVNVKSWHILKKQMPFDAWDHSREWLWTNKNYHTEIHPYLEPILNEYLDKLVADKPDVVGFSLYYTNEQPTLWMAGKIRKLLPETKIIVGGPQAEAMNRFMKGVYHHVVEGEGEQVLLDILNGIESGNPLKQKTFEKNIKIRIDLDSLPFPDYSDYNMQDYITPLGMSSEISRGCIAKCVFCTEVHFWKYRDRTAERLLNELEYQIQHFGLTFVWFIDSLVNGNLRQLRGFCLGVKERGIDIKWQGYARCDGRMDLEYFKDLAHSGCKHLSYGIESGSQKVLDQMKKEIKLDEIEDNLRDGNQVGIQAQTNWIVGFPNEDTEAFADTLILIWRIRNYNVLAISAGISMMLSPGSEITDNKGKYNIAPNDFLNLWTTTDLKNTKVHRLIRQKSFAIFIEHLNPDRHIYGCDRPKLKETYEITYNDRYVNSSIDRETYDYNIIQTDLGDFANTVMNEIWPLLRTFYRALNDYSIVVRFDPAADMAEFGDRLGCNYTAVHRFTIDKNGYWQADFSYDFQHLDHDGNPDPHWPDHSFSHVWAGTGQWN